MGILVFGGTTEGRKICNFLKQNKIEFCLSVATDYGKTVMNSDMKILQQRLDSEQIKNLLLTQSYHIVIDATHPYATQVTQNIKMACHETSTEYIRVIRDRTNQPDNSTLFETSSDAVRYLNSTSGNILLVTGSKDIQAYTKINSYQERLFVRILPMPESLNSCLAAGIKNSNIICMQGPFTKEMDIACIRHAKAKYLLTKDSGRIGGMQEKIIATKETNTKLLILSSKQEEVGFSYDETIQYLRNKIRLRNSSVKTQPKFPLFIDLSGKKIVVIGGGNVAERRIKKLLKFSGQIKLVSPCATEELQSLSNNEQINFIKREYKKGDLESAFFVIVATDNRELNKSIYEQAKQMGILANLADCKENSEVWFPSLVENSEVVVGIITTEGNPKQNNDFTEKIRACIGTEI